MDLIVHVPEPVADKAVEELLLAEGRLLRGAGQVVGDSAHVLHAAGDLGLGETEHDVVGGDGDGFHAGGADFVDGGCVDGRSET